jgi:hypothetical protein
VVIGKSTLIEFREFFGWWNVASSPSGGNPPKRGVGVHPWLVTVGIFPQGERVEGLNYNTW